MVLWQSQLGHRLGSSKSGNDSAIRSSSKFWLFINPLIPGTPPAGYHSCSNYHRPVHEDEHIPCRQVVLGAKQDAPGTVRSRCQEDISLNKRAQQETVQGTLLQSRSLSAGIMGILQQLLMPFLCLLGMPASVAVGRMEGWEAMPHFLCVEGPGSAQCCFTSW